MAEKPSHECCPKDWEQIPNVTGDYDFDGTVMRRNNPCLAAKLDLYTTNRNLYGSTKRILSGKGM